MTTDRSDRQIEPTVRFLNVDLDIFGDVDRKLLLGSFGDAVYVVHDGEHVTGEPVVSLELSNPNALFPEVIFELAALVRALPDDARAAWNLATRRVFNIGIQAGLTPHCTEWTVSADMMAALLEIKADVAMTVYGADVGAGSHSSPT